MVSRYVRLLLSVVLVGSSLLLMAPAAQAAPGEPSNPGPNPDLEVACGLDIHVILDESGSVKPYTDDVKTAFRAFTSSLKNTGSRLAVSEFSTVARLPLTGAAKSSYTVVTDATIASTFEPYISQDYRPDGSTNWEDGFRVGRYMLPRPGTQPHLVVFITDGNPNKVIREDRVTQTEYENKVPLGSDQVGDANEDAAADRAVSNSNAMKAQGSHVLALAVGDGLSSSSALTRLKKVSGPDVYSGGSDVFDIATTDVYREPDFSKLQDALRAAAFQLCSPSVTVRKLVDLTPDTPVSDAVPGSGFDLTADVTPNPSRWVLPIGASGTTATATTDGSGFANFQWENDPPATSTATITEDSPDAAIPGLVYDPALTTCTYRTPDQPDDLPLTTTPTPLGFRVNIPTEAIVTCTIVNRLALEPAIALEKSTNGSDADTAPGPSVPVGDPVDWTYAVTNTGNVTLTQVAVSDDQGVSVSCPETVLAQGASMTCTGSGTAQAGQYANLGTVTAKDTAGTIVRDTDPSHYTGVQPGIDIEKSTDDLNGDPQDADRAPGPYLRVGEPVTWTYVVTNDGAVDLTSVTVLDDQIGPVTCPATTLAVGASFTCTATGTVAAGQYENIATATGLAGSVEVADSDASHYFGSAPAIDIEKSTNGHDADTAPGPRVATGSRVGWVYVVTNTGNVPLSGLAVTDDQGVTVGCPKIAGLLPGQSLHCFGAGQAKTGQYTNLGSVSAQGPTGLTVTDSDPSHYFGFDSAISVKKLTNGADANTPPGPFIPVGGAVTWTYLVTNTGNAPLTAVALVDIPDGPVSCPKDTLDAQESMTCIATGTAQAGPYENTADVTAVDELGRAVTDSDPSHYFGASPGIHVEKSTNGDDADEAPGPLIPVGDPVDWRYEVTNSGNLPLTDVTVADDKGVSVTCPGTTLAPLKTMICTGSGVAAHGQYENTATATGSDGAQTLTDSDPSHYLGYISSVTLTKYTNGEDANLPTGPYVRTGDPVAWTYVLTNTGDINLASWQIRDSDPSVRIACPTVSLIAPGESLTCAATGTAKAGQYANTATADVLDALENELTATDPSHYYGASPAIDIETATNGEDADTPPGPQVTSGSTVTWTYVVTNTGNVALESLEVVDDRIGAITCPATTLSVAEVVTCTATGVAGLGQYANVGTATAVFQPAANEPGDRRLAAGPTAAALDPITVTDSDPTHYLAEAETVPPGPGTGGGGSLPFTGMSPLVPWTALVLLVSGTGLLVLSRRRRPLRRG